MIADWRAQWNAATLGEVSSEFPFGYVQLNGDGPGDYASTYNASGSGNQDRARGSILPPTRFDYDTVSAALPAHPDQDPHLTRRTVAGRFPGNPVGAVRGIWVQPQSCAAKHLPSSDPRHTGQ